MPAALRPPSLACAAAAVPLQVRYASDGSTEFIPWAQAAGRLRRRASAGGAGGAGSTGGVGRQRCAVAIGARVLKRFGSSGEYAGVVTRRIPPQPDDDDPRDWYEVLYEDGETEHYWGSEVRELVERFEQRLLPPTMSHAALAAWCRAANASPWPPQPPIATVTRRGSQRTPQAGTRRGWERGGLAQSADPLPRALGPAAPTVLPSNGPMRSRDGPIHSFKSPD